jgi:hypothetical protein
MHLFGGKCKNPLVAPPTMSTFPLFSKTAACPPRGRLMLAAGDQVSEIGSYNSVLAMAVYPSAPPATSTFPFRSRVAVCHARCVLMLAAGDQESGLLDAMAIFVGVVAGAARGCDIGNAVRSKVIVRNSTSG